MYQRARKLAALSTSEPQQFKILAEQRLEAYAVSINALSLVDSKSAWIVLPFTADSNNEVRTCLPLLHFPMIEPYTSRQERGANCQGTYQNKSTQLESATPKWSSSRTYSLSTLYFRLSKSS